MLNCNVFKKEFSCYNHWGKTIRLYFSVVKNYKLKNDKGLGMKEVKFEDVFKSLKNNLRLILISTLSVTLVSAIITFFFIPPEYEASTKVYIGKERFKNVSTTYTNEEINMYQRLIKTYSELVKTKDLVRKSISNAGQDISVKEALSKLQAISIADTQILQIKYASDR